jgi:hypothetical protein
MLYYIKGFRVELDGVAAVLEEHPQVSKAVAMLIGGALCGFLTPDNVCIREVEEFMSVRLPYYSVPSRYLSLEQFPMTV